MYYVLNVLMTLGAIASSSFTGYLLQADFAWKGVARGGLGAGSTPKGARE